MIDGLANLDAVCSATASRTEGGWRALDLRAWDGIDARLLPDRGLDCFGAWYRGVPLAWVSAVGERGPLGGRLRDDDWLLGFGGGLVATCGLRNVGAPSEGHGLHGEISHQPAREVRVARWVDGRAGHRERVGRRRGGQRAWASARARAHVDDAHGRGAARARRRDPQPRARAGARAAALPRQPRGAAVVRGRHAGAGRARDDAARRATRSGRGTGRSSRLRVRASASSSTRSRPARTGGARRRSTRPPRGCG